MSAGGREILVLQASGNELRLVRACLVRDGVELSDACSFLSGITHADATALCDETAIDALAEYVTQRGWVGHDLVCLVGGSMVACHYYDMPPLKGDALRQAVLLKLDQQLHFDVAEAVVAVEAPTPSHSDKTRQLRVAVSAIHRDRADAAIDAAARTGLHVKALSAAPAAITAIAKKVCQAQEGLQAFLHFDERISTLMVFDGASPCITTELPIGMADLTKALMRPIVSGEDVIQLDEAQATSLRNEIGIPKPDQTVDSLGVTGDRLLPLLEPPLEQFTKQLTQWLTFASTMADGGGIASFKIVGPGVDVHGLAETIASRLSIPVVAEHWLSDRARLSRATEGLSIDSFSTAVGAALYWQALPDLMPLEVRRRHKMRRIRKSVTVGGMTAAAAIVILAIMFDRMGRELFPSVTARQAQLSEVRQFLDQNNRRSQQRQAVAKLQQELDDFSRSTPSWVGVFKELSVLLPEEVQVSELTVRLDEPNSPMTFTGIVFISENGRSFDEAVEQTLLLLQRSAFFKRVSLLTANREPSREPPYAEGTLTIELHLVYPQLRT